MKNKFFFILMLVCVLSSCRILAPNDTPGWLHHLVNFQKESYDSLQFKTDLFVKNTPAIQRYYSKDGSYDKGKYRMYKMLCGSDTLYASIVFTGTDSLSRIGLDYFKIKGIAFNTIDHYEQKKQIKENQALYDASIACYENTFINPLINSVLKISDKAVK